MMNMVTHNSHSLREFRPKKWWAAQPEEMVALPEHIVDKLVAAGFNTVEDVRAADPKKIRLIEGIGRVAFEEIKTWLQSLDDEESGDGAGRL